MTRRRILIADDEALMAQGLKLFLESSGEFEVIALAGTGQVDLLVVRNPPGRFRLPAMLVALSTASGCGGFQQAEGHRQVAGQDSRAVRA